MEKVMKRILTAGFYILFLILFISNNRHLESFARKIEEDMIRPYQLRNEQVDETGSSPLNSSSSHEVTTSKNIPSNKATVTPTPAKPNVTIVYITPTPVSVLITEEELWNALKTYRSSHGKGDIQKSDKLCDYARKRAHELTDRLADHPDDPLDAHAGFSRDADSGYVFQATGFNTVGENLAYTPGYTSATQIIEWGWDTSPGHRSLQLSSDITHGCLTGVHPIYVGIYTY